MSRLHRLSVPLRTALARKGVFLLENDRRLWGLRDKHAGKDAVVIGMGPSLRPGDLERFRGMVSLACNKIYLAYEGTDWRPDYYCVSDAVVAQNCREEIGRLKGSTKLFPERLRGELPRMDDAIFFRNFAGVTGNEETARYTDNPIKGVVGGGATVLIPLIQAAYWMGCRTVYVVGLDFSFQVARKTEEKSSDGEEVLVNAGESNHFHKDYRKEGEKWTAPRMEQQALAFEYARRAFEAAGRRLLNASRVSKLEALERVDFEEVFPVRESPGVAR